MLIMQLKNLIKFKKKINAQNNNKQDEPFRFIETTEREEALGTRLSGHIHLMLGQ